MFGREKIVDPYNTRGTSSSGEDGKRLLRRLEDAARTAPDRESQKRINAYKEDVAANYAAGYPKSNGESYRNLTRSDCAILWPGSQESKDSSRRP